MLGIDNPVLGVTSDWKHKFILLLRVFGYRFYGYRLNNLVVLRQINSFVLEMNPDLLLSPHRQAQRQWGQLSYLDEFKFYALFTTAFALRKGQNALAHFFD